jgi:hypothetical protein
MASSSYSIMDKSLKTILLAGSVAGTLDIICAFVLFGLRGIPAFRILQGIASGLLGKAAFAGGAETALLGAVLHFLIAFSAAAIFYFASRRIAFLIERPIASGLLYGVLIYAFMNGIVLPLSAVFPKQHFTASGFISGVIALMLLVGLPISLIVHRAMFDFVPGRLTAGKSYS